MNGLKWFYGQPEKDCFYVLLSNKSKKGDLSPVSIKIGNTKIEQEKSTKLLGMNIQDNLCWNEHFKGNNGLIPSLNKRLFDGRSKSQIKEAKSLNIAKKS